MVDEMQFAWSGSYPANRSPKIISASLAGENPTSNILLEEPFGITMTIEAEDPEGRELEYDFVIRPEFTNDGIQSGTGRYLNGLPDIINEINGNTVTFDLNADMNQREFRMYAFVTDDNDNVGYWSIPFSVDLDPGSVGGDQEVIAHQDAYIRDGFYVDKTLGKSDQFSLQTKWSSTEGYNRSTYVSFQVNDIPQGTSQALFKIFGGGEKDVEITLSAFTNTYWTEDDLMWENARTNALETIGSIVTDTIADKYYEWDVGEYLRNLNESDTLITFVLSSETEYIGDPITWTSRETVFNAPKLDLRIGALSVDNTFKVKIYPNPAQERVQVSGEHVKSAILYDMLGQEVLRIDKIDTPTSISHLKKGVYLMRVQLSDGSFVTHKFIYN